MVRFFFFPVLLSLVRSDDFWIKLRLLGTLMGLWSIYLCDDESFVWPEVIPVIASTDSGCIWNLFYLSIGKATDSVAPRGLYGPKVASFVGRA